MLAIWEGAGEAVIRDKVDEGEKREDDTGELEGFSKEAEVYVAEKADAGEETKEVWAAEEINEVGALNEEGREMGIG